MKNRIWTACAAGCMAFALAAPMAAQADVKVEHVTHFGGFLGMAANDSTSTEYLQGEKKREESNIKFTGSVLGTLQRLKSGSKGSSSVTIQRVDLNKLYDLDTDEKTYSERDLYEPEEQKGKQESDAKQEKDKDTKITKNEFTVKATGKTKTINGFETHEYLVTWDLQTENTKTHEKGRSLMTTDMWNASTATLEKARQEELAYARAYMKLMHLPSSPDELKEYGFGTATISGADAKPFFDKLRTIKGYPISTDVTWEASDTGAKNASTQDGAQSDQDAGNVLAGLLNSDDSKKSKDGMSTLFTSHTEVKSVDVAGLSKSLFEVPEDYKKD